jgi:isopenicillin-N N-acyltransferase-like protein
MNKLTTITLTGSPRERGYQHGKTLKDGIHRFYEVWMKLLKKESPFKLTETALLTFAKKSEPFIRQYAPNIYEEMKGIAKGAEIDLDKILFINCFEEANVIQGIPKLAAGVIGVPSPSALQAGCTSFAVFNSATIDRKVYIGQNVDYSTVYIEPVVFRIEAWGDEPEQLVYSYMGVVGVGGINAAGLAIIDNTLVPSDPQLGVPFPIVMRKALQQTILSNFVGAIITAPRLSGHNYIIGSSFAAVDIETSATKYDCKYLQDGVFGHANHYEFPAMKHLDLLPELLPDTLIRSGRMLQLLKAKYGKLDIEVLKEIMRDNANYPIGICRHEDKRHVELSTGSTLIYRPEDRLMLATYGNPCTSPFEEFAISYPYQADLKTVGYH